MRALEVLLELDVINVAEVRETVEEFANQVESEVGKRWFRRTLARFFLNQREHNRRFTDEDFSKFDLNTAPDGLRQKVLNHHANDLWVFDPQPAFLEELRNVVHWIQANEQDARFLRQLPKITVPIAIQKAHQWNLQKAHVEARVEGVEKVLTYPNGWYWAKYEDKQTMMVDGAILQNCLRHGTYWNMIETNTGAVYGLRDPQHQPHVGVATRGKDIIETKGKQNEVVVSSYVPYVTSFFNRVLRGYNPTDRYIQDAGIFLHEGKFGSPKEVGEHIKTSDRDAYVVGNMIFVYAGDERTITMERNKNGDRIVAINGEDTVDAIVDTLETLKLPPIGGAAHDLEKRGVFYHDGRYGSLDEVAERIEVNEKQHLMVTGTMAILMDSQNKRIDHIGIDDGKVVSLGNSEATDEIIDALNALAYPAGQNFAVWLYQAKDAFTHAGRYGRTLEDVASIQDAADGYRTYVTDVIAELRKGTAVAARLLSFGRIDYNSPKPLTIEDAPTAPLVDLCNRTPFVGQLLKNGFIQTELLKKGIVEVPGSRVVPLDQLEPLYSSSALTLWEHSDSRPGSLRAWAVVEVGDKYHFLANMRDTVKAFSLIPRDHAIRLLNEKKNEIPPSELRFNDDPDDKYLYEWLLVKEKSGKYYDALEDSQETHYVDLITQWHRMDDGSILGVHDDDFMFSIDRSGYLIVNADENDEEVARNAIVVALKSNPNFVPYEAHPGDFGDSLYSFVQQDILPAKGDPQRLSKADSLGGSADLDVYKLDDLNFLAVSGSDRYRDYYRVKLNDDRTVNQASNLDTGDTIEGEIAADVFNVIKVAPDQDTANNFDIYLKDDSYFEEEEYVNEVVNEIHGWDGKDIGDVLNNIEKVQNIANGKYLEKIDLDRAEQYRNYPDDVEDYVSGNNIILMDSHGMAIYGMDINWREDATEWPLTDLEEIRERIEEDKEDEEDEDDY